MEKPPVGLVPRHIWEEQRISDIKQAIERYLQSNRKIPLDWIQEYNKLLDD